MTMRISRIYIKHIGIPGILIPVLFVDIANVECKLYTLCYSLPQDTSGRTERRISLLLRLIHKNLTSVPSENKPGRVSHHEMPRSGNKRVAVFDVNEH